MLICQLLLVLVFSQLLLVSSHNQDLTTPLQIFFHFPLGYTCSVLSLCCSVSLHACTKGVSGLPKLEYCICNKVQHNCSMLRRLL